MPATTPVTMRKVAVKVLLLGNQGVGKTSILLRQSKEEFNPSIKSTIGASFSQTSIQCDQTTVVIMQVWDTAGQERFRSLVTMYYRNADAALLVYDVTDRASFEGLQTWVEELEQHVAYPILVVVGNKIDMSTAREVTADEGAEFANRLNAIFVETSASSCEGIETLFNSLAKRVLQRERERQSNTRAWLTNGLDPKDDTNDTATVTLQSTLKNKKSQKGCCGQKH